MTDQPDNPQPDRTPDPAAPPPPNPDPTSAPGSTGGGSPISGQPWSTPSGDPLSPEPYRPPSAPQPPAYSPGYAAIPQPEHPPTSQFPPVAPAPGPAQAAQGYPPPVNYAPPGQAPDYGPPTGYAQQPGYGPPGGYPPPPDGYGGYPPPGYPAQPAPYGPPQPPPRRSNAPIIAVILAVTLLLCGGLATAGVLIARNVKDKAEEAVGSLPTAAPDLPGLPTDLPTTGGGRQITVTYEVTGDGPASIVYLEKIGESPTRLEDVKLPWKFTAQAEVPALLSVVAIRVSTSDGTISCRALVDGEEVKQNKSGNAAFATTNCTQLVLE